MAHATQEMALEQGTINASKTADAKLLSSNGKGGAETENVVVSYRGSIIENRHRVHAAVVSPSGNLLHSVGSAQRATLARSSTKPIQALAILQTGAATRFKYSDADIALMCASHSSEPRHVARASAMLAATGEKESVLTCGGHPAQNASVNLAWIKSDFIPTPLCNNCSGKHAGMVAGALSLGATAHDYYLPDHPMQKAVYRAVEDVSGLKEGEVGWTVDGCNLPTPAMPLCSLGVMFAKLADAADQVDESGQSSLDEKTGHLSRIYKAMATHPGLVAGEGRFDTELIEVFDGLLVGKIGADACYGIGIRTNGQRSAIGIAVKVEDGNMGVLYAAIMEILDQLGVGSEDDRGKLEKWRHPSITNTAGVVTGTYQHRFRIKSELDS